MKNSENGQPIPIPLVEEDQWVNDPTLLEYAPERCYTFAKEEKKGAGKPISFRLPAWFFPEIERLCKAIPDYDDNPSHLLRDALYHRLHFWRKRQSSSVPWQAISQGVAIQDEIATMARWLSSIKETKRALRTHKDRIRLQAYLAEQMAAAENAAEPWRSRLIAEIRRRPEPR